MKYFFSILLAFLLAITSFAQDGGFFVEGAYNWCSDFFTFKTIPPGTPGPGAVRTTYSVEDSYRLSLVYSAGENILFRAGCEEMTIAASKGSVRNSYTYLGVPLNVGYVFGKGAVRPYIFAGVEGKKCIAGTEGAWLNEDSKVDLSFSLSGGVYIRLIQDRLGLIVEPSLQDYLTSIYPVSYYEDLLFSLSVGLSLRL